jgi:RIO kinase 1
MLERDVNKMRDYYGQFAPQLLQTQYAKEMWALYEDGELHPDTELTGSFNEPDEAADVDTVMEEIRAVLEEQRAKQERQRED